MKQVIDITTPTEEEQEEFPAVLAAAPAKKHRKKIVKPKQGLALPRKKEETAGEHRTGEKFKQKKKKEKIRISFSFSLPKIAVTLPLIAGSIVVILAGAFVYFTLQAKAVVSVKPVLEPIKIEEEIKVSSSQNQADLEAKIIPGQVFEKEMEQWKTFKATGKETEQSGASGSIFVYNNTNPPITITLKEGTRFLSSKDGKVYKAKEKIVLPPAILENGKLTPSVTTVQVIAQEEGEEYNIAPAKFSVPGLAGSALYYTIWGESKEKIEGGSEKEVYVIIQQDIDNAHDAIANDLQGMILAELQNQVPGGFILNQDSVFFNEPEISCSSEAGAKLVEFNCYAKAKAKAIFFKDQDLKEIAKWFIGQKISTGKTLYENSLIITETPQGKVTDNGDLILSLKTEAKLYDSIDQQALLSQITSKNQEQIRILIANNYPQIERIGLEFWPFWIKKTPKNTERIKMDLTF
ncbi:MAG: hypothetical protein PHE77_03770 [Candidatus Pacebacteria bacterium]|nr:hypothetical protein [Candidatus Paceibacterota bacterium]